VSTTRSLTILQINDTHGYLQEHQELFWAGSGKRHAVAGGYARIKSYFDQVRADCGMDAVIALDNGDTLHGTFPAVNSHGEALIEPLNRLGLDAWTVHWDFVYGPGQMHDLADQLIHPLLAANCHRQITDALPFAPWRLVERGGIKVGIIGLAATIIDKTFPPDVSEGLYFTLGAHELSRHIQFLREKEGAELIIVLSHLGFPQDCKLVAETSGIDILLSGHTHNRLYEPVTINGTTIIQSGCHGSFVGRLDIEMVDNHIKRLNHQLVALDETIAPEADMQRLVDEIYAPHKEMLAEVAGMTATDLNRYTNLEATMDNLLLDGISAAADTEIAFSNGWRYGAPIPAGEITVNDLWNIIPTNPPVETVEMSGLELWNMMEENLQHTFADNPYHQMGGYVKRCRGINLAIKIENRAGLRIQEFYAGGERLEAQRRYRAAFVTAQGVPAKYGRQRREAGVRAIPALQQYLAAHGEVQADLRNTVVAI
jgi:2',3'-cyclic-nucleotide 2'-phosphodiesterase (5'-nucleotidase family)